MAHGPLGLERDDSMALTKLPCLRRNAMAYIVVAYIVMAYIVIAYIVMALTKLPCLRRNAMHGRPPTIGVPAAPNLHIDGTGYN